MKKTRIAWKNLGILLLTLSIRLIWITYFPDDPIGPVDAEGFHLIAQNMLAGNGFAIGWDAPFCPTAVRTPLYPLFLIGSYVLLGTQPAGAVLLQMLLEVLTAALVIRLGQDLHSVKMGTLAGLLYALNGTTQRYTGYVLSEALLLPILTTALLVTLRALRYSAARYGALAGLFWALSILTKPNVQFLALGVGLLLTWRSIDITGQPGATSAPLQGPPRWKIASHFTFWCVLVTVLIPWCLRNRFVMERWLLSTAFEENLARVSAVAVLAEIEGVQAEPWTETWEHLYGHIVAEAGARYAWSPHKEDAVPCVERRARQRQVARIAREIVWQHPQTFVATHLWGVELSLLNPGHHLWYRVLTEQNWETTRVVDNIWTRVAWSLERGAIGDALGAFWSERVTHIPLDAACIWWTLSTGRVAVWWMSTRGIRKLRRYPAEALLLFATVVYLLLLPGPIAYDRFYVPAVPAVVTLVALGLGSM